MARALATVSVDIDPIDLHLLGYGFKPTEHDTLVYTQAVPRLLDAFKKVGIRATFFLVARDAPAQKEAIDSIVKAGHEIASHSLTHPAPFASMPAEQRRREIIESKRILEEVSGKPVIGFRAPNWDCSAAVLDDLAGAGYRYDASGYPSMYLLAARLAVGGFGRLKSWPFTWNRAPHPVGKLWEFPVTVTGAMRTPVYHTMRFRMHELRFISILDNFDYDMRTFTYALHAIDVLGIEEDKVDARLARHPGMNLKLEEKRGILRKALEMIAARFQVMPYKDHLPRVTGEFGPDRLAPS